jgi:hypothetical protein
MKLQDVFNILNEQHGTSHSRKQFKAEMGKRTSTKGVKKYSLHDNRVYKTISR